MDVSSGSIRLTASDLVGHHDCHHLTMLEKAVAVGSLERPRSWSPLASILAERGDLHEKAYVQHLVATGVDVVRVEGKGIDPTAVEQTIAAMHRGSPAIVQGALRSGRWGGRLDVLWRVETPSRLGGWSYEAIDAKLSRLTKGNTLLQLSLYSELIGDAQGVPPEKMGVVTPWSDFIPEMYRVDDFAAYYRLIKARLASAVDGIAVETYPEPNSHCELCRWRHPCDARRRSDDHLTFRSGNLEAANQ